MFILWSCRRRNRRQADVHRTSAFNQFKSFLHRSQKENTPRMECVFFLAEMEGFEPPHALRRLADFESAPFSHLGTSPCKSLLIISARLEKIKAFPRVSFWQALKLLPFWRRWLHNSPVCGGAGSRSNPLCHPEYSDNCRRIDLPGHTEDNSKTGS